MEIRTNGLPPRYAVRDYFRTRAKSAGELWRVSATMGVAITIAALLATAVAASTREGRAEARKRMELYNKPLWIAAGVLWSLLILGWILPRDS